MSQAIHETDFLVIGSGLAGLTFALHAAQHGKVTVLTKSSLTDSSTSHAQGGIAAAVGESDSWKLHEEDTLIAGAGICDKAAVRALVQAAPEAIRWLRDLGASFNLDSESKLALGREGGHSRHRIIHHQDKTGWEIERAVSSAVLSQSSIEIFENAFVTGLDCVEGRCVGASAMLDEFGPRQFRARATMLATGGCGKVYSQTTNPRVSTGDGVALARRIGAQISGMEFMQFHPTTLYHEQAMGFLISEAVRGAGATLRNHKGRRFMRDYDSRLELAPRDIVARSIAREMNRLDTWCVYLDSTHLDAETLHKSFPTIWDKLRELGIQMESDWAPIVPAQHYSCGGVATDLHARSSVPGLYASGETASTGVHGANRLASNSLLEAIVFSQAGAEAACCEPAPPTEHVPFCESLTLRESEAIRLRHQIQRTMSAKVGIFRTDKGLADAADSLSRVRRELERQAPAPFTVYGAETVNLLDVAEVVVESAQMRKVNVGLHYNIDNEG